MTTSLTSFSTAIQLDGTAQTLVSAASTEKKYIGKAVFTNTSASNVTVTVWKLASSATPTEGSGGNWLDQEIIAPNQIWHCDAIEGQGLGNSEIFVAKASTASVVNFNSSGITQ